MAEVSEWLIMFSTSKAVDPGSIGTATRPKAVMAKNDTVQFGIFSAKIAIFASAVSPWWSKRLFISLTFNPKEKYV